MKAALAIPINPMLKEEFLDWLRRIDPTLLPDGLNGLHEPYRAAMAGDWKGAMGESGVRAV